MQASHAFSITERFAVGDGEAYPGVDGFVTTWHNRNLRIFQNILNASKPGDDMVVIIGAGHVPLLRRMVQCSPDFELVEVVEVLGEESAAFTPRRSLVACWSTSPRRSLHARPSSQETRRCLAPC